MNDHEIAGTIINALAWDRFQTMTGVGKPQIIEGGIEFSVPGACDMSEPNWATIERYPKSGLFLLTFSHITRHENHTLDGYDDLTIDQLRDVLTKVFRLSL